MATTFRSDAAGAIGTLLTTFAGSNPTLMKHIYRARPPAVNDTPASWIGDISEAIQLTSGVMRRTFNIPVVVVHHLTESQENANLMDDAVDALIELFVLNPHAVSANTLIEPVGVSEVEIEGPFRGVAINLRGLIQEGRP